MKQLIAYAPPLKLIENIKDRLCIPLRAADDDVTEFCTGSGLVVAMGFARVVIGKRGPYVEFDLWHLNDLNETFHIPEGEEWRIDSLDAYYVEWRTRDEYDVMMYQQRRLVQYADYSIGAYYISPTDLYVGGRQVLCPEPPDPNPVMETFG